MPKRIRLGWGHQGLHVLATSNRGSPRPTCRSPVGEMGWEGPGGDLATSIRERTGRLASLASGRAHRWVLLGVGLALGALLRFAQINGVGFNSDEAVYAGQAAALADDPTLSDFFPIFRAHPLLFQFVLSIVYRFAAAWGPAEHDLLGRLVGAAVGLATLLVTYRLGAELCDRRVGALAALLLGLMPYHVVVSRQVILDGPMTLMATLTLLLLARFCVSGDSAWILASGAALGLTFLAKETGILFAGSIFVFFALSPEIRLRLRDLAVALFCSATVMAAFPLSLALAGGGGGGKTKQYFVWQLMRRPNHEWDFYLRTVPAEIGLLVLAAAVAGVWLLRREGSWKHRLLLAWIAVPTIFFLLWPTKGFQYLVPIAPVVALFAARGLIWTAAHGKRRAPRPLVIGALQTALIVAVAGSLLGASWTRISEPHVLRFPGGSGGRYLAGSGGVPGGREVGRWINEQVPAGASFMTIGPSMANIVQFYGHRRAYGLSVSSNPLRRNPSYTPLKNPDRMLRNGDIQYLVWDPFSAKRSRFFSKKLLHYATRYNGRVVFSQPLQFGARVGPDNPHGAIKVIEVRP